MSSEGQGGEVFEPSNRAILGIGQHGIEMHVHTIPVFRVLTRWFLCTYSCVEYRNVKCKTLILRQYSDTPHTCGQFFLAENTNEMFHCINDLHDTRAATP